MEKSEKKWLLEWFTWENIGWIIIAIPIGINYVNDKIQGAQLGNVDDLYKGYCVILLVVAVGIFFLGFIFSKIFDCIGKHYEEKRFLSLSKKIKDFSIPYLIMIMMLFPLYLFSLWITIKINFYFGISILPVAMVIGGYIQNKYQIMSKGRVHFAIAQLILLVVTIFSSGIAVLLFCQSQELEISWGKELFFFQQDQQHIIEIHGNNLTLELDYSRTKSIEAYLTDEDRKMKLQLRQYRLSNCTYVILDLTDPQITEGVYNIHIVIDGKDYEKKILYMFSGTLEEKSKYVDKYIRQIQRGLSESQYENNREKIEKFKNALLEENTFELNKAWKLLKTSLPEKERGILNQMCVDSAIGIILIEPI